MEYINRELSWIEFNQRVLSEAQRDDLPLLERLKFLAITASNLDEFFQVRVGGLTAQVNTGSRKRGIAHMTPGQQLKAIRKRVQLLYRDAYELYFDTLSPNLANKGIHFVSYASINHQQKSELLSRFEESLLPLLTPLGYIEDEEPPTLPSLNLIIVLTLENADGESRVVFIPIPDILGRFLHLTDQKGESIIGIEEVISENIAMIFEGETVVEISHFRITRNGDIAVHEEDALDLAGEMEEILIERKFSNVVRLEIPHNMPKSLLTAVCRVTHASADHIYRLNGPINLSDFMQLAFLPGYDELRDVDWTPQPSPAFSADESMFDVITERDVLLYHPYESFEPVIRLLEEAATDPYTLSIKQVLYRTAKDSRIIDALIKAAENGKQVTVLVEIKARFDEARNLQRADELQRAGVQIVYGVKNLKTHAKILLIIRNENGKLKRYMHLGTGNYNESTSKLYTDASYLTSRNSYGNDASAFFNAVTGRSKLPTLKRLIPAPTQMKRFLLDKIASEAKRAKSGENALIMAKVNSLQDQDIIDALYKASQAGVKIQLNIRGICCLKTQDETFSKNIKVVSVIDRYLEHARIIYFHQGGDQEVYIASADWMTRNLEKRVELMIPILDKSAKKRLIDILHLAFDDNSNAHVIQADGSSVRKDRGKKKAVRMQATLQKAAEKATKAHAFKQATTFEPHTPSE